MKFKKSIAAFGLAVCVLAQPAKAEQSKENCKTYRLSAGHDRATLAATNFTITNDGPESVVIETDGDQSLREIIDPSNNSEVNGFAGDPRFTYFVRLAKADGRSTITVCSHAGELDDAEAAYDRGHYATALQLLQPLAERGVANAQMLTGVMYAYGLGVSQDYAEALEWLRKSAEQNHPIAQYYLGVTYAESKGVRQDFAEALKWFLKAADQHYAAAQRNIGVLYVYGHGVPLDNVQALMWWLLAADGGDADAITSRDIIAKQMTPNQIAKAKRLAQKWLAAHPQP